MTTNTENENDKSGNDEWSLGGGAYVVLDVLANLSLESLKLVLIIKKACTLSAGAYQIRNTEYKMS